jgi:hypothetical protein
MNENRKERSRRYPVAIAGFQVDVEELYQSE